MIETLHYEVFMSRYFVQLTLDRRDGLCSIPPPATCPGPEQILRFRWTLGLLEVAQREGPGGKESNLHLYERRQIMTT